MRPQTAMADAMESAGWTPPLPPFEQAVGIAIEAWTKWSMKEGGGVRRDYVKPRLTVDMLWAMIEQHRQGLGTELLGALLNEAARRIKAESVGRNTNMNASRQKDAAGEDQRNSDTHLSIVLADLSTVDKDTNATSVGGDHSLSGTHPPGVPADLPLTDMARKHRDATLASVAHMIRMSRLDTVKIDGRPIGDCLVSDVRKWADRRRVDHLAAGRDWRFAMSLVSGLSSNDIVRDYHKDMNAVDRMYERAQAEYAE